MKILLAVDGSHCSMQAIESVIRMTCPIGTEFNVVTAVNFYLPLSADIEAKGSELRAAQNLINDTVDRLKHAHPNASIIGNVLEGHIVEEILRCSEEWPADLIMLGSHGRTGFSDFILGSVSRAVLSNANCAVRIVRPYVENDIARADMNVLVALEESEHSRHLIDHLLRLPWPQGTKFKLLNVTKEVDKSVLFDPEIQFTKKAITVYDGMVEQNEAWIKQVAEELNQSFDQEVATSEVKIGEVRKVILEVAKSLPADIIMLGSHSRQGIEKLLLGSVSEAVASHAHCTVEVTRVPSFRKSKVKA